MEKSGVIVDAPSVDTGGVLDEQASPGVARAREGVEHGRQLGKLKRQKAALAKEGVTSPQTLHLILYINR